MTALDADTKQAYVSALERAHGQNLRRYIATRLRNAPHDVPDLVQEVFLRMLRLDNHELIRNSQAYLYTVASHVLHQHALRQSASPAGLDITATPSEPDWNEPDPSVAKQVTTCISPRSGPAQS